MILFLQIENDKIAESIWKNIELQQIALGPSAESGAPIWLKKQQNQILTAEY